MGGGSALRAAGRSLGPRTPVVGGIPANSPRVVSFSLPTTSSSSSLPLAAVASCRPSRLRDEEEDEEEKWEARNEVVFSKTFDLGPVPSIEEAQDAVSILKQILGPFTFSQVMGDGKDMMNDIPSLAAVMRRNSFAGLESEQINVSKVLESQAYGGVLDAFRLLQLHPYVEKMVTSLSSDEAVWDAVMKNVAVQEIRKSFNAAETSRRNNPKVEGPDIASWILRWIYDNSKVKIMEIINKILHLINGLFNSAEDKHFDILGDVIRSSLMLSVMVFVIVIVTRFQRA